MNGWPKEELLRIAEADDLRVAPLREDGVAFGVSAWVLSVVVEEALYVRGYSGKATNWYQAAARHKTGRINSGGILKEVTFEPVQGPSHNAINDRIDHAYRTKYQDSPYLNAMIGNRARAATVKIMPR